MAKLRLLPVLALMLQASPAAADPAVRWRPFVEEASARFRIPVEWIERVMRAESGGRDRVDGRPVRSVAGAMGLMQLMPGTWRDMRRAHGLGADPDDPRDNILAGAAYLRDMYDLFGHPGLFAAYHAGPARYRAHVEKGHRLPRETHAYVGTVAPGARLEAAAEARGLFFPLEDRPEGASDGLFAIPPASPGR